MDDVSTDLKAFLDYMGGRPSEHKFVQALSHEVMLAKQNKEWRREYMTLLMRDRENIEKGREEGIKEGIKEGEFNRARISAKNMLLDGISPEKIARYVGLSLDDIRRVQEEMIAFGKI